MTDAIMSSLPPPIAQVICGHKNIDTTIARGRLPRLLGDRGPPGRDRPGRGGRIGRVWLARSRFADVARLAGLTLTLGEDARALYQLGWAKTATGDPTAALAAYGRALRLYGRPATAAARPPRWATSARCTAAWVSRSGRWSTTGRRCRSCGRSGTGPGKR